MTIPSQRRYVAYYAQLLFLTRQAVMRRDPCVPWPISPAASAPASVMHVYRNVPLLLKAVTLRQANTLINSGASCTPLSRAYASASASHSSSSITPHPHPAIASCFWSALSRPVA